MYRTHTCGELRKDHVNQEVSLAGWVESARDHGGIIFIDLRDRYGLTQLVFDPEENKESHAVAEHLRSEFVVTVTGKVRQRGEGLENPNLPTGQIEIVIEQCEILSKSKALPFELDEHAQNVNEELRLQYRFIDLRRKRLKDNIIFRHQMIKYIRDWMDTRGFLEITTPILANSSPEGARDYLVPSRIHPGKFYALPQAPQQFKQLLMVAGFDKYFQIAPCFRDEDPRADRSPGEFYQLDIEMSFVTQEDVWSTMEPLFVELTEKVAGKKVLQKPFPRFTYTEVMEKYGSDKPDLRFGLEIQDISEIVKNSGFSVFADVVKKKGVVRAMCVPGLASQGRSMIESKLLPMVKEWGGKGLAYFFFEADGIKSPLTKFMAPEEVESITKLFNAKTGDVIFFSADRRSVVEKVLGNLRSYMGEFLNLKDPNVVAWCWVKDFPFYEWSDQKMDKSGKLVPGWDFMHNPFSMPQGGLKTLNEQDPGTILAYQYDIVANGLEISSGGIRNHDPETLYKAFELVGYTREETLSKFGHMIRAFEYGCPPHGGFAPGIDRMLMLFKNEPNIREVIPFPKNGKAQDVMLGAPSEVSEGQLKELGIRIVEEEKK